MAFLFALLFAGSIEALVGHHHDDLNGDRQCAVCQVVGAVADTPQAANPASLDLPEAPGGPVLTPRIAPASTHLLVPRLRAPPAV